MRLINDINKSLPDQQKKFLSVVSIEFMFKKKSIYISIILLLAGGSFSAFAQLPIFLMPTHQDITVHDCKGEFHDSDAGPGGTYLAQASDTFRICTGGTISMSFLQFQLENGFDTLFFYNGTAMNSGTLIGAYTGSNTPTGITANGCLTVFFKSSFALQDIGWVARWRSTVVPPVPPTLSISGTPLCNTTSVTITLSKTIKCDSVYPSAFKITGPVNTTVTGATAIGCSGDSTNSIQLQLSTPLTQNCNYTAAFTVNLPDNCDSIWKFTVTNSFIITDCPVTVSITPTPNDTVCSGSCVQLHSVINSCLAYNYYWSNGLSNAPIQMVCPATTTTYTLGVQSTSGGPIFNSSITITVLNPHINPPIKDTVCQSDVPFDFTAFPAGGVWSGKGITDSIHGTFDPDTAMQGVHTIYYKANGFCKDSFAITVIPMYAGLDEAACPGSSPFALSGYLPPGGTWSGYSGVSSSGIFNPTTAGTYTITYTHPNGCSDTKQVFVQPLIISNTIDSICQSQPFDTLTFSPPGGRWTQATGVIDTVKGVINPRIAGGGLHDYYYKLHGCMDTLHLYIKPVDAGYDLSFCPLQTATVLGPATPAGGIWSSIGRNNNGMSGLVNSTGLYNPNIQGVTDFTDTLIYTATNGCSDTMQSYIQLTNIIKDSLFFCSNDDSLILKWETTQNYPGGGAWTGAGIIHIGNKYYFKPSAAGIGAHILTYTANTCSDTMTMVVYPSALSYHDTTICSTHPAFILDSIGLNASWQGTGIVNTSTGLFDPAISGVGSFPIRYTTPAGCSDSIIVTVYPFQPAQIAGLNNHYCFKNSSYPANLIPTNGIFTGQGVVGSTFNPSIAGTGQHLLIYSYGSGFCFTSDTLTITIDPPIQTVITTSNSSICRGGGSTINVTASGGDPSATSYSYLWNHGLFSTNTNVVSPTSTTTYVVTTSDGCSDDKVDSLTVAVYSSFSPAFTTSPINCNGTAGFINANVTGPSNYSYSWSTTPVQTSSSINGSAGSSYSVKITDIASGCFFDTTLTIPGYGIIHSLFSINPNLPCVPYDENEITFIDLSLGATQGYWEVSDGTTIPYVHGQNIQHTFTESGTYTIKLHVENIGNCADEFTKEICIAEPFVIFVPDIFSPNGDGTNDMLFVRAKGFSELNFIVYDRWGEKVFETTTPDKGWDGRYKNKEAESGVYVWYLNITMLDGSVISKKGDVTLIR